MAQKRITELDAISALADSDVYPVDDGVQTFKGTPLQMFEYLATKLDDSTIEESGGVIRVKDAGITKAKLAAVGDQDSTGTSGFTDTGTSFSDIANMAADPVTVETGRPVLLILQPHHSSNAGYFGLTRGSDTCSVELRFVRGSTALPSQELTLNVGGGSNVLVRIPCSAVVGFDIPGAGTHTYKLQSKVINGTLTLNYAKLIAIPL